MISYHTVNKQEIFNVGYIHHCWAEGKHIILNNIKYRVGKMSYDDYFLEPGIEGKETDPFNMGTLWLKKVCIDNVFRFIIE